MSPRKCEKATKFRFTASSISSMAISSTIRFLRFRKMPTTDSANRMPPSDKKWPSVTLPGSCGPRGLRPARGQFDGRPSSAPGAGARLAHLDLARSGRCGGCPCAAQRQRDGGDDGHQQRPAPPPPATGTGTGVDLDAQLRLVFAQLQPGRVGRWGRQAGSPHRSAHAISSAIDGAHQPGPKGSCFQKPSRNRRVLTSASSRRTGTAPSPRRRRPAPARWPGTRRAAHPDADAVKRPAPGTAPHAPVLAR